MVIYWREVYFGTRSEVLQFWQKRFLYYLFACPLLIPSSHYFSIYPNHRLPFITRISPLYMLHFSQNEPKVFAVFALFAAALHPRVGGFG